MQKIFDRNKLRLHRDRAAQDLKNHNFLLELSSIDILERLMTIDATFESILEIGARTGDLTKKLMENYISNNIVITDISKKMLELNPVKNKILIDEEELESISLPKFDVIVSVLNLHHINDIKKFLSNVYRLLEPNGIFVASLFGAGSLSNLRSFLLNAEITTNSGHSPHISPFATASDIYRLLQITGFEFIVTDTQKLEIDYDNPLACMYELRNMGESSTMVHSTRAIAKEIYLLSKSEQFSELAEIITLTAGKKTIKQKFVSLST